MNLRQHSQSQRHALAGALLVLPILLIGSPFALRWWTDFRYRDSIYTLDQAPKRQVAIVFGAGIWPDGTLSAVLEDRVITAVELYKRGRVTKILMTGDNRYVDYNEPQHMREYALALGVPDDDIVLDLAGRRTYDSCYRAIHIFEVADAILVSQAYHLDRALFIANGLGLDAIGVAADRRDYMYIRDYWWREMVATSLAWWQVHITKPEPVLGDRLPIIP